MSKSKPPDQVAAITGGAGDIGSALCKGLAHAGIKTAVLDIDESKARSLAKLIESESGTRMMGVECDVLSSDSLKRANRFINEQLGPITSLINCAGGNNASATTQADNLSSELENLEESFFGIDVEGFRQCLDLNLLGTVLPSSILGKALVQQKTGSIVNISSMNAYRPLTKIPAYSAAKCAVSNFTQWLAVHLAPTKVRVNAIAPGFFITEQLKYLAYKENGELTPRYERVLANTPMGRFGKPEELVGTLLYLLSEGSRFVTGTTIPVDGGFNAYSGV
jgi:NAD(P)-dependent dehydrogenase (short-subunit alcohol dehydrogenase family)